MTRVPLGRRRAFRMFTGAAVFGLLSASVAVVAIAAPGGAAPPPPGPTTTTCPAQSIPYPPDGNGANVSGPYNSTCSGPSNNGNGNGNAIGKPCAGCVGNADNKNPPGQLPGPQDNNNGYECDGNNGIAKANPAHTGCTTAPPGVAKLYLGYADDTAAGFHTPALAPMILNFAPAWLGLPGTTFLGSPATPVVGCGVACQPGFDAGLLRIENTTGGPITLNAVTVTINGKLFDLWTTLIGGGVVVPAGDNVVLTQTIGQFNFDTSEDYPGGPSPSNVCTAVPQPVTSISVTINGTVTVLADTGMILTTGGHDALQSALPGNETTVVPPWTSVGDLNT